MAGFYRNGILVSADVLAKLGIRTLTGAGQEEVWPGTATTRPTPSGQQLRLVSSSVDDDQTRAQKGTITIAGTMDPALTDEWTVQLAGGVDLMDKLRLTLNGTNYDTMVEVGATIASLVAEVATSAGSGTWDSKKYTYGGTIDVGDTARLTINGTNYDVVSTLGTANEIVTLLVAAAAADPLYDVTGFGADLRVKKKIRGVGATVSSSWIVDAGGDATVSETVLVVGVAGQAAWTCTDDGVDTVTCTHATAGATADTVASSVPVDGGAATTFTATHATTGADADILRVTDGTATFTRTVQTAVLNDEVAALAALLDAHAAYLASAVAGVITVTAAVPGVGFTFTDTSVDNQTADLVVTIDNTALVGNGDGPGVRAVAIDYLDGAGLKQREVVDLDGTTPVTTVATDVTGILAVTATEVGANGGAAGTISVTNTGATVTFDQVAPGASEAPAAVYVVPVKKQFWLHQVQASASAATTIRCKSTYNPVTGQVVPNGDFVLAQFTAGASPAVYQPAADVGPIPAGARVWLTAQGAGNPVLQGTIEGYQAPAP